MMAKRPSKNARIVIALKALSGNADGITEHFFEIVHGVESDILDTLVKACFATVDVEYTKQGIEIVRYHITDAGRHVLSNNPVSAEKLRRRKGAWPNQ